MGKYPIPRLSAVGQIKNWLPTRKNHKQCQMIEQVTTPKAAARQRTHLERTEMIYVKQNYRFVVSTFDQTPPVYIAST